MSTSQTGDATIQGFRLSPQQRHLWALLPMEGAGAYRASCTVHLTGEPDADRLERALAEVVGRHEILRTVFQSLPGMGEPLQVILAEAPSAIRRLELAKAPVEAVAEALLAAEAGPFDLERGPLLEARLSPAASDGSVLVLEMPALLSDSASLDILVQELASAYGGAGAAGVPVQYVDVAEVFNELLEDEHVALARELWRRMSPSPGTEARLPFETGPPGAVFAPATAKRRIGDAVAAALDGLAGGRSLEAGLLTAWAILLARLCGRPEVHLGVGLDGRTHDGLDGVVGPLRRLLPVRLGVSPETPFDEAVAHAREMLAEVGEWQDYFSPRELETIAEPGDAAPYRHFAFELDRRPPVLEQAGVRFETLTRGSHGDRFAVKLTCEELRQGVAAVVVFDPEVVPAGQADLLAGRFRAVVEDAVAHPSRRLGDLDLLDPGERRRVTIQLAPPAVRREPECRLERLVLEQAARTPDRIAVAGDGEAWSYGAIEERSRSLAERLAEAGVSAEVPVAILAARRAEVVVAILAVLRAGGLWVPVDPTHPEERRESVLADAGARALLSVVEVGGRTEVRLEARGAAADGVGGLAAGAESLAYVIYTSGSTGRPKGVAVSHQAIVNRLLWMQEALPLADGDRVLQKTSLGFDASIWELFCPLLAGASVILGSPGVERDPAAMVRQIARERVSVLQLVPSLLRVFLDQSGIADLASLRRLFCGGEALPRDLLDRASAGLGAEIHNLYGPTETAIDATWRPCRPGPEVSVATVPLGRPIANARVHLGDPRLQPVAMGVEGELCVAGSGLARGYLDRPAATAERFVPDPFSDRSGARLYRTGDLARLDELGELEYLGRIDQQVKLRGFRVELGEIEAALRNLAGVGDVVVALRRGPEGRDRLVAYVVPGEGWAPAERLGLHRLPNGLEVVPLNRNEADFIYREIFEQGAYLRGGVALDDGDLVFDVGANVGLFSLYAADRFRDLRIWAFEPVPQVFEKLRANVELYGLEARLFPCALGARSGRTSLTFYPRWSGMSGVYADAAADAAISRAYIERQEGELAESAGDLLDGRFEGRVIECPVRTLSEVIRQEDVERIDLLKVDVERSELDVLLGLEEEDWPKVRQLALEVHDEDGRLNAITSLLEARGFSLEVEEDSLLRDTGLFAVYAAREPRPAEADGRRPSLLAGRHRALEAGRILESLRRSLPEYEVPGELVFLDDLPRTASGKVDRGALPEPERRRGAAATPPRSPAERKLAEIWCEVLGLPEVGVFDNFFELGGDSILSIQIVTRANRAGLHLLPRYVFRHQTIAELAAVADDQPGPADADTGDATEDSALGPLPLTPIQHAFFEHVVVDPHHHNQALLLAAREPVDASCLARAVEEVVRHHDALRLRFERAQTGWSQVCASPREGTGAFHRIDLSRLDARRLHRALEGAASSVQAGFDLASPPLARVVLFDTGPRGGRDRVLLVAHHLVVDGVSWRIVLEDLAGLYQGFVARRPASLPEKTTSFRRWALGLVRRARELAGGDAPGFWLEAGRRSVEPLPRDGDGGEPAGASDDTSLTVSLDREETRALLEEVPRAYGTHIEEVLLTALAQTFGHWTGERYLLLDLESHGRETWRDDIDVSRTVGWFTALYPVLLDTGGESRPGPALKRIKEQLRALSGRRLEYGLLRHSSDDPELTRRLASQSRAEVSFNYLGQQDRGVLLPTSPFVPTPGAIGPSRSPRQSRRYPIEINGGVAVGRLHMEWSFGTRDFRPETVATIAEGFIAALRLLIAHCRSRASRSYTPSEFPLVRIDQGGLDRLADRLAAEGSEVEDLYPLSPLQQGLLFHTLDAPHSGAYFVQWGCTLGGEVDGETLREAWRRVLERHEALRVSFAWRETETQLQVVHRRVDPPWQELDWSGLSGPEQDERLDAWLRADRRRGFDPGRAPLMRFTLIRLAPGRSRFIWSHHHLLLDGWCIPVVLREVFSLYRELRDGETAELPPAPSYREYVAWLRRRDLAAAEAYWRRALKGFQEATPLPESSPAAVAPKEGETHDERGITLAETSSRELQELLRRNQLTLNTLAQAVWGLALGHRARVDDVVFGATVSGRPPELPGVERMVGLFINTLPVRVLLPEDEPILGWLRDLQERQVEARSYEHSPLAQVQEWSEVPKGKPLFEAIMTFENYPTDPSLGREARGLVGPSDGAVVHSSRNSNPLTLLFGPGTRLWARLLYDRRRFSEETIEGTLADLEAVLEEVARSPEATVGDLRAVLADRERDRRASEARGFSDLAGNRLRSLRRRSAGGS